MATSLDIAHTRAGASGDAESLRAHEDGGMTKLADLKKRWMKDPEFRAAYEEADVEYRIVDMLPVK